MNALDEEVGRPFERGEREQNDRASSVAWVALATATTVAVSLGALFELQVPGSNGPSYWRWSFLAREPTRFAAVVLPAIGLAVVAWRARRRPRGHARALIGLTLAFLWLELGMVGLDDHQYDLRRVARIVASPTATSYWTAALDLLATHRTGWLEHWHAWMPTWPLHARNKPPLPVLFYAAMHALADREGALIGGLLILLTTTCVLPVTYRVALRLGLTPSAALRSAGVAGLCPTLSLIAPEFDQIYPLITLVAIAAWWDALRRGSALGACSTGLALFVATSFAFHLAVLGLPLAVLAVLEVRDRRAVRGVARLAAIALGTFLLAHLILRMATRYDVIAVFREALADRRTMSAYAESVGSASRLFDLTDFALGLGWPTAIVALGALTENGAGDRSARHLAIAGWTTVLALAMLRLLPTETARTWAFLMPLFFPAAGAWLDRRTPLQRRLFVVAAGAILIATARNLVFVAV
jgi:hypothetical protein